MTVADRHQRRQDRVDAVREATKIPMVRVVPRDETIRKYIAHMPTNIKFPKEGSARWPFDKFTKRRIADGDVTVIPDEPAPVPAPAPEMTKTSRKSTVLSGDV